MTTRRHALRPVVERAAHRIFRRADASADAAELAVRRVWDRLLAVIAMPPASWPIVRQRAFLAVQSLAGELVLTIGNDLVDAAKSAHADIARAVARSSDLSPDARAVPVVLQRDDFSCGAACLAAVAQYFGIDATKAEAAKVAGTTHDGTGNRGMVAGAKSLGLDAGIATSPAAVPFIASVTMHGGEHWVVVTELGGDVKLMDPWSGNRRLSRADFDAAWHDERATNLAIVFKRAESRPSPTALLENTSEEDARRQPVSDLIIPTPDAQDIMQIILGGDWQARIAAQTRLAPPDLLAALIANGFASGQAPAEIARTVRPHLQGVQTSARRVARTESVRVSHEIQMDAWDNLGDMVVGFEVHSAHFPTSRWWHIQRDGTQYFKNPTGNQKGLRQMPRPPMEADDPSERPAGTPHVAHNCLCYLTPILA